jgi:uncharacterized membrane protein YqaE (UPF0057 family)
VLSCTSSFFIYLKQKPMKMKNLLSLVFVFLLAQGVFSCRSGEHFQFTGTNPEAHNKVKAKPAVTAGNAAASITMSEVSPAEAPAPAPTMQASAAASAPVLTRNNTAPAAKVPMVQLRLSALNQPAAITNSPELSQAREKLSSMSKAEKRSFKKELRQAMAQQSDVSLIVLVILAILLPPLAVALKEGITSRFWISLLLTLLFFLPGVIYALLVVTDTI